YESNPNDTSILLVTGNSFEWQATAAIALGSSDNTTFAYVIIDGNQFSVSANSKGVSVENPGYEFLDSMLIGSNIFNLG
ncbi:hypothetical protein JHQ80_11285, partial [Neisseria meningitidis]|uniref:hypothetical protein n=1 Tax=Neisseria meningitidis TaxID=487 RepID=UPI001EDD81A3